MIIGLGVVIGVSAVTSQWDEITASLDKAREELEQFAVDSSVMTDTRAESVGTTASDSTETILNIASGGIMVVVSKIVELGSICFLTLFATYFYLRDSERIWSWIISSIGNDRSKVDRIGRRCFRSLSEYLRGVSIVALFDAALISLGAIVLGVPFVGAIFVITFILAFIPYVGAFVAGTFASLLAVAVGGVGVGVAMMFVVVLVQQFEGNFLDPIVIGRVTHMHPLVVTFVVIAAGAVMGLLGALIAVPITTAY